MLGLRVWFLKPMREDIKGNKLVSSLGVYGATVLRQEECVCCDETMSKLDLYVCFIYGRNEFSSPKQIGEMSELGNFKAWKENDHEYFAI